MASYKLERELAHKIFWKMKADADKIQREYDAEAAEYLSQGFRPERCIHGTYMWVEWDCACQECELGEPLWDDARDWDIAKWRSEQLFKSLEERAATYNTVAISVRNYRPEDKAKLLDPLWEWVWEPMKPWQ